MSPISEGGRPFNLYELLAGSEGTLAMMFLLSNLEEIQPYKCMIIPHFRSIDDAMNATIIATENPVAVELIDDIILDATKENIEHQKNRFFYVKTQNVF